MGEWAEIPSLLKLTWTDIAVWLVTFALTVFADLTIAVEVGMILAALLFIARVADTTTVELVTDDYVEDSRVHILQDKDIPDYVAIYRIHGPFLFGTTDKIDKIVEDLPRLPPIVVLRLRNMTALDATGVMAMEEMAEKLHASGRHLLVCGARKQPAQVIDQSDFRLVIGRQERHAERGRSDGARARTLRDQPAGRRRPERRAHHPLVTAARVAPARLSSPSGASAPVPSRGRPPRCGLRACRRPSSWARWPSLASCAGR